ncbi:MAG TPA: hypothetical protein VMD91_06635 [Candidatus Sulfotelmatobacter sp.]|nr:hypothetical protein [Candidatus Sulfotelmatobacter sp.]
MSWLGDLFGGLIGDALAERGAEGAVEGVLGMFGMGGEGEGRGSEGYDMTSTYDRVLGGQRKILNVNDQ